MRKRFTLLASIAMGILAGQAAAPDWGVADTLEHYEIGPGIQYIKIRYESVPLTLWATTIDMTNPYNAIEQVQSNNAVPDLSRELVQDMSKRLTRPGHKVCAAFNHDFFSYDAGICIGLNASNGLISWSSGSGRSTFAITQDKTASVFFPVPQCSASLPTGESVAIDQFNWGIGYTNGDCVLFTNLNALTLDAEGRYIKLRPLGDWIINGEPTPCRVVSIGHTPIQPDGKSHILFMRNDAATQFESRVQVGDVVQIDQRFVNTTFPNSGLSVPPAQQVLQAFHGWPSVILNGELHDKEYNDFVTPGREFQDYPCTLVGITKDGKKLFIIGVDGSNDARDQILSGDMTATAMQPAALIAETAVRQADKYLKTGSTGMPEKQLMDCEIITIDNAKQLNNFSLSK